MTRGDPHSTGRRTVIRYATCRVNRVCRHEPRNRLMRGNQPADDAERADSPADRVLRTPVASAAGDTAGTRALSGRQCNRRLGTSRCRRHGGQRLPVACAVRPVHVDAGRRQCREAVLAGPRTGGAAKGPLAAERRHVIERSDARAGECACNGDEGRWGHEGGAPCDTGNRAGAAPNCGCKSGHCGQPAKPGRSDQSDFCFRFGTTRTRRARRPHRRGDTRQMSGGRGMMREPCRCARRCAARRRRAAMPVRAGPAPRASSDPCGADSRHPS